MIEACFFDLDKTVIDEQGRLYEGLHDALDPEKRGFYMTVLTARGYPRFQQAVRENPSLAVTPGMPVALENGARIVTSDCSENLFYQPLSKEEQEVICDYINEAEPLRFVAFHTEALRSKTLLWSPDITEAKRLHDAYSSNADVFTGSRARLFEAINQHNPCMVTCRTYGDRPADLPEALKWYSRGSTVNFIPHGVDKGRAAQIIADMTNLSLDAILAAGNDSNDLPVLKLDGLGHPVAVGPEMTDMMIAELPVHTAWVPDPRQLGSLVLEKVNQP